MHIENYEEDETAVTIGKQYPERLKSHLKELAQLGDELKKIKKESKKSVQHHKKMKVFLKETEKKTKRELS